MKKDPSPRSATGLLAKFYHDICANLGINFRRGDGQNSMTLNTLIERWLSDPVNCISQNNHDRQTSRTNIVKEITAKEMSWKTFIKGIKFINVNKFELTVTLWHKNGTQTVHSTTVVTDIEAIDNAVNNTE
jgi:hypothetical protein